MSEFSIETEKRGDTVIARLAGEGSVATANEMQKGLMSLVADEPKLVVLEMSGLSFMSSLAMGSLISLQKRVQWADGKLKATGLNETLMTAFQRARLDKVIEITDSLDAALEG